jgi:hypothetical protein
LLGWKKEIIPTMIGLLRDKDAAVRRQAVEAFVGRFHMANKAANATRESI